MRRIVTTLFAVFAIAIVILIMTQAQSIDAPWVFTAVGILMIIVIVMSLVRTWLRRY
jgi:hypothetical protein